MKGAVLWFHAYCWPSSSMTTVFSNGSSSMGTALNLDCRLHKLPGDGGHSSVKVHDGLRWSFNDWEKWMVLYSCRVFWI